MDLYIVKNGNKVVVGTPSKLVSFFKKKEILVRSASHRKIGSNIEITIDAIVGGYQTFSGRQRKHEERFIPSFKAGLYKLESVDSDGYTYRFVSGL